MPLDAKPPAEHDPGAAGESFVILSDDALVTNDRVIGELAEKANIFAHANRLVEVIDDEDLSGPVRRLAGAPRVHPLAPARVGELVSHHVDLRKRKVVDDKTTYLKARMPREMPAQIIARGRWPRVRRLVGIIEAAGLRLDGSLLDRRGYDDASGLLLLSPAGLEPRVPERPTRDDAVQASKRLLDLLAHFPADDVARSAWLAALLTAVARDAIDGPVPAVLIDANAPATGKGLAADVIGIICTGRSLPIASWSGDNDEARKTLLTIALGGDRLFLIDNLIDELRSGELDAALTSRSISGRLLGTNTLVRAPFDAVLIFTGNNVSIGGDLFRRLLYIRLQTDKERPEEREGLPDLRAYARANRTELLAAALIILRAYVVAGRPRQQISSWGSFEAWSDLVRGALAWLGLADPAGARDGLRARADRDLDRATALHAAWAAYCEHLGIEGATLAKVVADLKAHPNEHTDLRAALEALDERLRHRSLGQAFSRIVDRVVNGRRLVRDGTTGGVARWKIETVEAGLAGREREDMDP